MDIINSTHMDRILEFCHKYNGRIDIYFNGYDWTVGLFKLSDTPNQVAQLQRSYSGDNPRVLIHEISDWIFNHHDKYV